MQGDGFDSPMASASSSGTTGRGGWHWILSIVSILIVAFFAFGMAYLTKSVEERPVWMMGLIFMIPTAALMIASMLVEGATSAMTPSSSRGPQLRLAIIATVATFLVGYICDLIYLQSFKKELPPAQSAYSVYTAVDQTVFVLDDTYSMQGASHDQAVAAVEKMLAAAKPDWKFGMLSCSASGTETVAIKPLDASQKNSLTALAKKTPAKGRLYYENAVSKALDLCEGVSRQEEEGVRLIVLTDGLHAWSETENGQDLMSRCLKNRAVISCVALGDGQVDETLRAYVERTGGQIVSAAQAAQLMNGMEKTLYEERVKAAEVPENEKLAQDLLRNNDPAAKIITLVMLLLEGLSLGICLSLMLSVSGQFRAQYLISPLMGALAYVLLKVVWNYEQDWAAWWIKEGISFSLLGVVFMMRNHAARASRPNALGAPASSSGFDSFGF